MKINFKKVIVIITILFAGCATIGGISRVFAENTVSCLVRTDSGYYKVCNTCFCAKTCGVTEISQMSGSEFFEDAAGNRTSDKLWINFGKFGPNGELKWLFQIPTDENLQALKGHEKGKLTAKAVSADGIEIIGAEIKFNKVKDLELENAGKEFGLLCFEILQSNIPDGVYDFKIYDEGVLIGTFHNVKIHSKIN